MALLSLVDMLPVSAEALVVDESPEPQALRVIARLETAVRRRARVRRVLFTGWCSLSCPCDGDVAGGKCAGRG
jgi:hypothetical protein